MAIYWVLLLCVGVATLVTAVRPEWSGRVVARMDQWGAAAKQGVQQVLPLVDRALRVDAESANGLLAQSLPRNWGEEGFDGRNTAWLGILRSLLFAFTGYDPAHPDTFLLAELPGHAVAVAQVRSGGAGAGSDAPPSLSQHLGGLLPILNTPRPSPPGGPFTPQLPPQRPEPLPEPEGPKDAPIPAEPVRPEDFEPLPPSEDEQRPETLDQLLAAVEWGQEPLVAIFHTHASEMYRNDSFAPERAHEYHRFGTYETGIVRVGERIAATLEQTYGIPTVHDRTLHDTPCHSCAYLASRKTVESLVKTYPSLRFIIDVHRDGAEELSMLAGNGEERVAQIALVVGRPANSARHPLWEENDRLARHVGELLERRLPGIFRRVIHLNGVYNQDLHPGAMLVEIGNYFDHEAYALRTAELFADVIAEALYEEKFGVRPVLLGP